MSEPATALLPSSTDLDLTTQLLHRCNNGETLNALALEIGLSCEGLRKRFYRLLFSETGDGEAYRELVTESFISRIADADLSLETAESKVAIARARAQAQFTRMDFERRRPHLYGPKQEIKSDTTITVVVHREQPSPLTISTTCEEVPSCHEHESKANDGK